jgi:hypothetical protein
MTTMNVFQRINAVRKAIGYVQKDKAVSTGGGSYKAVTHDAVTGMVRAALIEHGVVIVPSVVSAVFHPKETPDSKQRLYEATYQIEFVNCDDPADRIVTNQHAHALDNGDKAPGKAMSYATKYAILKLFNIETGEDEESRYQQDDYDFGAALTKAEQAETADAARAIIAEAKSKAVALKDKAALNAVNNVIKTLTVKFKEAA